MYLSEEGLRSQFLATIQSYEHYSHPAFFLCSTSLLVVKVTLLGPALDADEEDENEDEVNELVPSGLTRPTPEARVSIAEPKPSIEIDAFPLIIFPENSGLALLWATAFVLFRSA